MAEIPKAYEPQSVEDKWYDFWLKQGCFTADRISSGIRLEVVPKPFRAFPVTVTTAFR